MSPSPCQSAPNPRPRLPITQPSSAVKVSRAASWRTWALLAVHVLAAIHITHWLTSGSTLTPLEPSEGMALGQRGILNAGFIFFSCMILLTAIFGRFFCGWACHLVALQDLSRWWLSRIGIRPRPFQSRFLKFVPLGAFVYMFLWPAIYRAWAGESLGPIEVHLTTSGFWDTFPGWLVGGATFVICGFVAVYFLGAKGFCTYACPYGAAFAIADQLAPGKIRVTDDCEGCGHCTATCTSNVLVHQEVAEFGMVVDSGCMKCMDCVSVCPKEALYFGLGKPSFWARLRAKFQSSVASSPTSQAARFSLSLGEECLALAAFMASLLTFRGLYGLFPFLLSLGWSSLVAFMAVQCVRLVNKPQLQLRRWSLKKAGSLQPTGWAFVALALAFAVLWAHSGIIQYRAWRGLVAYEATQQARRSLLLPPGQRRIQPGERALAQQSLEHLQFVDRHGLRVDVQSSIRLAWLSLLNNDREGFEKASDRALNGAPSNATLRLEFAEQWLREGMPRKAEPIYAEALDLDPSIARASLQLGLLQAQDQRYQEAASTFRKGLTASPEHPELHYNLALTQLGLGQTEEAVELLRRAVSLSPHFVQARENLAGLLCSLGRFEEGIEHYNRAISQSPEDPTTYLLLARAHLAIEQLDQAKAALLAAQAIAPGLPQIDAVQRELAQAIAANQGLQDSL